MLKRVRLLDAAIIVVVIAILAVGGYFAYSVWANNRALSTSSPANREIQALRQKLKKAPNDIESRMRLAQALSVAGRSEESVEQYQEVLKLNEDWVPALSGVGFELLKRKDWAGGEKYFKRVIELTADKTPNVSGASSAETANYYVGIARMEQRDYSGAIGYLKEALRMRKDASDTAYAISVCYGKLDIKQGQREMLEYTLKFDPKMPEANYDYAMLLLDVGNVGAAAEHFATSSKNAPYKEEPKAELAKLGTYDERFAAANRLASTEPSAALAEARVAASLDSESVEARLLVGKLYEKLKKDEQAAVAYEQVLAIDPGNKAAKAGLKRVKNGS